MNSSLSPAAPTTLSVVIHGLLGAVGVQSGRRLLDGALAVLLFRLLSGICGKMERLAARFQAGRLWRHAPRPASPSRLGARPGRPVRALPGGFGWLVQLIGYPAAGYGSQLRAVLGEPEMVALLAASPQAVRLLRPLCRMLAVERSALGPVVRRPVSVTAAGMADPVETAEVAMPAVRRRAPTDWGRIPLPRGVLSAAKRRGFRKSA